MVASKYGVKSLVSDWTIYICKASPTDMRVGSQLGGRRSIFVGPSASENSNHCLLLTCARKAKPARMVRTVQPGVSAAVSHHLSVHYTAGSWYAQ